MRKILLIFAIFYGLILQAAPGKDETKAKAVTKSPDIKTQLKKVESEYKKLYKSYKKSRSEVKALKSKLSLLDTNLVQLRTNHKLLSEAKDKASNAIENFKTSGDPAKDKVTIGNLQATLTKAIAQENSSSAAILQFTQSRATELAAYETASANLKTVKASLSTLKSQRNALRKKVAESTKKKDSTKKSDEKKTKPNTSTSTK